jgi:hypothetical protein
MNIKLLIDRLVLEGTNLSHSERRRLQTNIETELTLLLSVNGVPDRWQQGGTLSHLSVQIDADFSQKQGEKLGQNIAHAIYQKLL